MRQLSHLYELQKLKSAQGEEDSWLISEKQDSDNYVSVVSFAAGKIRRVARFRKWTQDDDSVDLPSASAICWRSSQVSEGTTKYRSSHHRQRERVGSGRGVGLR